MVKKTNTSMTIDSFVLKAARRRAEIERRSVSSLIEFLLWKHCQAQGDFRDLTKAKASRRA